MQLYKFDDEALEIWIMKLQGAFYKSFNNRNFVKTQVQKQIINMLDFTKELGLTDHFAQVGHEKLPRNV